MKERKAANPIQVGQVRIGGGGPLAILAGPCVLEDLDHAIRHAETIGEICDRHSLPFVFKASFDKANRTSIDAYRGPGMAKGLEWLAAVKEKTGRPILTDIHEPAQAAPVAEVVDLLQIPAFLCRQTDLLLAAAKTGKPVNIKKGQFLSPQDMRHPLNKVLAGGNPQVLLTERGTSFGYNRLVVDFTGLVEMRSLGAPVVFDATHSVQRPGGAGAATSGDRSMVPPLARAAVAVGIDALFLEVHEDPDHAPSDGPNMLRLADLEALLLDLL
ncbi:MAG TPA: 3-deoxy-8-phosphooctulonate synthase [Planctomycetes bacterium]|nr:3-deoxy-8-phosphooctulonate synthase [Planctomycetota bacterium]